MDRQERAGGKKTNFGIPMKSWLRRCQSARRFGTHPQQEGSRPAVLAANSVSNNLSSGTLGPGDVAIAVPPEGPPIIPNEKPWYSLLGFSAIVARQRQKIPRRFRRNRVSAGNAKSQGRQEATSLAPQLTNDDGLFSGQDQLPKSGRSAKSTEGTDEMNGKDKGASGMEPRSLRVKDGEMPPESHMRRTLQNDVPRRGTAWLAEETFKEEMAPLTKDFRAVPEAVANSGTIAMASLQKTHGNSSPGIIPSSAEWVSSAVSIRDPRGEQDSTKLLYDTGSEDNMASRKFVEYHGFTKRPVLAKDRKMYETPNGDFVPEYYVEMELKDTERGIKDFVRGSFYIAESIGGYGLLAGQKFMLEHSIVLDARAGPGAFVLTSRKPGKGRSFSHGVQEHKLTKRLEGKEMQANHLDQTAKAIEQAKGYAASSAGSTTTGTGITHRLNAAAETSRTSISTGSKNLLKK